jgi:hypothetical protein
VSLDTTVTALMATIDRLRGVPACRQQIRLSNKKIVPKAREVWPLKRHGVTAGSTLYVEPTRPGAWMWNSYDYYVEKLLAEVQCHLAEFGCPIKIEELERRVHIPPCIPTSLRIVLRQYPDRVKLRSDVSMSDVWVSLAKGIEVILNNES